MWWIAGCNCKESCKQKPMRPRNTEVSSMVSRSFCRMKDRGGCSVDWAALYVIRPYCMGAD